MAATAVIGRDEELRRNRDVPRRGRTGPCRARARRRGGYRQDDSLGGRCRAGRGPPRSRTDLSRNRGGGILCLRGALRAAHAASWTRRCRRSRRLRRRALEVALLLAEPGEMAPDAHAIGLALLDIMQRARGARPSSRWPRRRAVARSRLGQRAPDRASPSSRRARRTAGDDQAGAETWTNPSGSTGRSPKQRLEQISVGPLSLGAVHRLLEERLGLDLTRPELSRVQEATAGNPFFALELGRELVRTNTRPAPGQALRVPESLHELLGGRLARLPGETARRAARGRSVGPADGGSGRSGARATGSASSKRSSRRCAKESSSSTTHVSDSSHPLLASICYEQAPIWKRRAVHRALASAVSDVEERARHLALAAEGPDAVAASYLDAAADHAAARGATATAAELCELAATLTPARSCTGATTAAASGRPSTASRATQSERSRYSSNCSRRFRPASNGQTCSSRSSGRSTPTLRR